MAVTGLIFFKEVLIRAIILKMIYSIIDFSGKIDEYFAWINIRKLYFIQKHIWFDFETFEKW